METLDIVEEKKRLQKESDTITKRLNELNEILYNRTRVCVIDTHTNVSHYRVIEATSNLVSKPFVKHRSHLIGVKPINCNVKLDFGGVKIPILDREVSLRVSMQFPMTCHNFDIWMTPIDSEQDYSIELKYTDDTEYTSKRIRDINNHNELACVIQNLGMFGFVNVKGCEV